MEESTQEDTLLGISKNSEDNGRKQKDTLLGISKNSEDNGRKQAALVFLGEAGDYYSTLADRLAMGLHSCSEIPSPCSIRKDPSLMDQFLHKK